MGDLCRLLVDDVAEQRAEKLIARILELDHRVDAEFYEMGRVLTELSSPDIYKPLGYSSFKQLLAKRDLPKREQSYRLLAITRELDAPTARTLGIERAYYAIAYTKLFYLNQTAATVVRRDPTIRLGATTYELSTIPTRLLRQLIQDKNQRPRPRSPRKPPPPRPLPLPTPPPRRPRIRPSHLPLPWLQVIRHDPTPAERSAEARDAAEVSP